MATGPDEDDGRDASLRLRIPVSEFYEMNMDISAGPYLLLIVHGMSLGEGRLDGSSTEDLMAVIFDAFEPPEGSSEDHAPQNICLTAVQA